MQQLQVQTLDFVSEDNSDTMTSLQIAEITGKAHKDVLKAIRAMEPAWIKVQGSKFALMQIKSETNNGGYKYQPCYSLNKTECLYIATKFNDEARAKLVIRWKELEEANQPKVPTTYIEALKAVIKAEEEKQQLALENKEQQETILRISKENVELGNKITEMLPKVSYYDRIIASGCSCTVTQIAQDYGITAIAMNKLLHELKIQHKVGKQWIVNCSLLPCGYVYSREIPIERKDGTTILKYNTEWTVKGRIFLYNELKKHGIIPLMERKSINPNIK